MRRSIYIEDDVLFKRNPKTGRFELLYLSDRADYDPIRNVKLPVPNGKYRIIYKTWVYLEGRNTIWDEDSGMYRGSSSVVFYKGLYESTGANCITVSTYFDNHYGTIRDLAEPLLPFMEKAVMEIESKLNEDFNICPPEKDEFYIDKIEYDSDLKTFFLYRDTIDGKNGKLDLDDPNS